MVAPVIHPLYTPLMVWLSLALSVVALACGVVSLALRTRSPHRWRSDLTALDDEVNKLALLVKKLSQRLTMRERREDPPEGGGDTKQHQGESDFDYKRRMRQLLAAGKLHHEG